MYVTCVCAVFTELSIRDGQDDLIHEKIAELNIFLGAALLQSSQDLDLRVLLADPPVCDKPHPGAHVLELGVRNFVSLQKVHEAEATQRAAARFFFFFIPGNPV